MPLNKEKTFISALVYINNQEKMICSFLKNLDTILYENFERYEIICINDGSSDNSIDQLNNYAFKYSGGGIRLINMSYYQGIDLSMTAGMDLSIGDFIYEFDTLDTNYSKDMIIKAYRHLLSGYDIVSVVPSKTSNIYSKMFYRIFNSVSDAQYLLRTETFRILSRRAINRVQSMGTNIFYRKAVYANCGLKCDTLTYQGIPGNKSSDRKTKQYNMNLAIESLILYSDIAYRCSMVFAVAMILFTCIIGLYTIWIYQTGRPIEGWTTIMLFLSFAFIGVFIILTLLIKYTALILKLCFKRQKYIIESIDMIKQ